MVKIDNLLASLDDLHKDVSERRTKARDAQIKKHNLQTHVRSANFSVGDFVLVAKEKARSGPKLHVQWIGPRRVTRVHSPTVFEVQDLINESLALVHANRLKFYADSQLEVTEELLRSIDHNDTHYNTVVKLLDLRKNDVTTVFEVRCKWRGFSHEEPTWEPIVNLQQDIPEMLDKFLSSYTDQALVSAARAS